MQSAELERKMSNDLRNFGSEISTKPKHGFIDYYLMDIRNDYEKSESSFFYVVQLSRHNNFPLNFLKQYFKKVRIKAKKINLCVLMPSTETDRTQPVCVQC